MFFGCASVDGQCANNSGSGAPVGNCCGDVHAKDSDFPILSVLVGHILVPMIEFEHVTKSYPDQTVAVADFSLAIDSHRTIALVGSSGSGKTTLLRMVNRMVEPTSGRVLIDGITNSWVSVVQGSALVVAIAFILVNIIVDVLYVLINPRIRAV